ncbi:MAG TPA: hypothetical protein DDZ41_05320 [Flavobacterium sp.]|nr:hypothetical protein [Flavobacterium sp.]
MNTSIYVYVIDKNNVLQARAIKVGAEMPHLYAVSEGLKENDKILVEGLRKVKNKQKVKYDFHSFKRVIDDLNAIDAE